MRPDFERDFDVRHPDHHGDDAHERERETDPVSPPPAADRDAEGRSSTGARAGYVGAMGQKMEEGGPDDEGAAARWAARTAAIHELQQRAAAVFAEKAADSFAGFAALVGAVMPSSDAELDDLAERLRVPAITVHLLIDGTVSWDEVSPDVIVTLAWPIGVTRQTLLDLLVRDLNAEAAAAGAAQRSATGWAEVTQDVLGLWSLLEGAEVGPDNEA